ncbi:MAG: hypothetical protein AAFX53_00790 [Bacteroidota bacterium]
MSKKNLDNLFQEKLKDFREAPDERVWASIEASLDKKKKKHRVIPLWWKLGGVAALLAALFYLIDPFENSGPHPDIQITDTEQTEIPDPAQKEADLTNSQERDDGVVEVDAESEGEKNDLIVPLTKESVKIAKVAPHNNNTIEKNERQAPSTIPADTDKVANALNTNYGKDKEEGKTDKIEDLVKNESEGIALSEIQTENHTKENPKDLEGEKQPILKDDMNETRNQGVAQVEVDTLDTENNTKKSIFDEIQEEEEDFGVAESPNGKWSAGPSVAPVYYNAIGNGSPVHSIFVPNSKSGEINLSYGLSVAYEVNKRLSVRSGVHRVDFGYNTNDIEFTSSLQAEGQIDNINYSQTSRNLVVQSKARTASNSLSDTEAFTNEIDVLAQNPVQEGDMAQQFGYIEVPLELNYALVDRKFGINLIGGVSSLFLVDNSVTVSSGNLTTEVGEANNVNSLNFSTNVGFGLNYKFTPKLQFNVEPIFKYQLNTFSETAGDFQPFTIGVYSGLNLRF